MVPRELTRGTGGRVRHPGAAAGGNAMGGKLTCRIDDWDRTSQPIKNVASQRHVAPTSGATERLPSSSEKGSGNAERGRREGV